MIQFNRNKSLLKRHPINRARQNRLTREFRERGSVIYQSQETDSYLDKLGVHAINYDECTIILRTNPTVSEVLEELYHANQHLESKIDPNSSVSICKAEIEAQKYLISVEKVYNLPKIETIETMRNLFYWRKKLEEELKNEN